MCTLIVIIKIIKDVLLLNKLTTKILKFNWYLERMKNNWLVKIITKRVASIRWSVKISKAYTETK